MALDILKILSMRADRISWCGSTRRKILIQDPS